MNSIRSRKHAYIHTCMHAYIHTYTYMHTYMLNTVNTYSRRHARTHTGSASTDQIGPDLLHSSHGIEFFCLRSTSTQAKTHHQRLVLVAFLQTAALLHSCVYPPHCSIVSLLYSSHLLKDDLTKRIVHLHGAHTLNRHHESASCSRNTIATELMQHMLDTHSLAACQITVNALPTLICRLKMVMKITTKLMYLKRTRGVWY